MQGGEGRGWGDVSTSPVLWQTGLPDDWAVAAPANLKQEFSFEHSLHGWPFQGHSQKAVQAVTCLLRRKALGWSPECTCMETAFHLLFGLFLSQWEFNHPAVALQDYFNQPDPGQRAEMPTGVLRAHLPRVCSTIRSLLACECLIHSFSCVFESNRSWAYKSLHWEVLPWARVLKTTTSFPLRCHQVLTYSVNGSILLPLRLKLKLFPSHCTQSAFARLFFSRVSMSDCHSRTQGIEM